MSTVDNLQIRLLKPEDAKGLAPLIAEYAQSIKRGVAQEADLFYTEYLLSSGGGQEFLGAFIEGELKAFCLFHSMPDVVAGLISGQINHIYVQDAVRGFGLGEAMMRWIAGRAASLGCARFDWTAETDNPKAIAFYDTIGATTVAEKVYFRFEGAEFQR